MKGCDFLEERQTVKPHKMVISNRKTSMVTGVLDVLADYKVPDHIYDREKSLLTCLAALALAEDTIAQDRLPYARELLQKAEQAGEDSGYFTPGLSRRHLLLTVQANPNQAAQLIPRLPSADGELLLRAESALIQGSLLRAAALLDAVEDSSSPRWNLLRGRVYLAQKDWVQAAACLHRAEDTFPETYALLEQCYRELGNYRQAYEYACKQKK